MKKALFMAMLMLAFTTSTAVMAEEYNMPETEEEVCYDTLGDEMPCPTDIQQEEEDTTENDTISVDEDLTEHDDQY